jgi:hypothetical protein
MRYLFCTLLFLFLFSCTIQKRLYNKGFYIASSKNKYVKSETKTTPLIKQNKPEIGSNTNQAKIEGELKNGEPKLLSTINSNENDSCDLIIFRDGTEEKAKVIEISRKEVKYKRCDFESGPVYVAGRSEVFMIKYANGTRELFKEEKEPETKPNYDNNQSNYPPPINEKAKITHPKAETSFLLGLLSLLCFILSAVPSLAILGLLSIVGSVFAVITARKAIREIALPNSKYKGRGLAVFGKVCGTVILSIVGTVIFILILALLLI